MYADRSFASRSYADATDAAAGRIPAPPSIAPGGPQVGANAQAANAFRTWSDRSWAASGRAAGAVTPAARTGANAQAAWAFRTWSDAAWAASGNEAGVPPIPPLVLPPGGGNPPQIGRRPPGSLVRRHAEPLSKREAKRLRKHFREILPHRTAAELEALYARLTREELPREDIEPVVAIVRPFAAASDVAPMALPPMPAVDFGALARDLEAAVALAGALEALIIFAAARERAARNAALAAQQGVLEARAAAELAAEIDDEEAIMMLLLSMEDD